MPYLNDSNILCTYDTVQKRVVPATSADGSIRVSNAPATITPLPANQLFIEKFVNVQVSDTGTASYVTGSAGSVKSIKKYASNAITGDPANITTYKYEDAAYPTNVTTITESNGVV